MILINWKKYATNYKFYFVVIMNLFYFLTTTNSNYQLSFESIHFHLAFIITICYANKD